MDICTVSGKAALETDTIEPTMALHKRYCRWEKEKAAMSTRSGYLTISEQGYQYYSSHSNPSATIKLFHEKKYY